MNRPTSQSIRLHFIATALIPIVLGSASLVAADEVALNPSRDNTLIKSESGTLSNGAGTSLFAGKNSSLTDSIRRGLLAFDLQAGIPAGSIITGATLTLFLEPSNAGPVPLR